jgi:hypothetical protein
LHDCVCKENHTLRQSPRDADRVLRSHIPKTSEWIYSSPTSETRPGHYFGRMRVHAESNDEGVRIQHWLKADLGAPRDAGVTSTDAPPPRDAGPAPKDAPPADAVPAAPSCTYSIAYTNPVVGQCAATAPCGARVLYDVTQLTATGAGCPASLSGLTLTEVVTNDHGCVPDSPQPGPGCDLETPDRTKPRTAVPVLNPGRGKCRDSYALCLGLNEVSAQGCTEIVIQKFYVGGVLADTKTITFRAPKANGRCSPGTVTRR